MVDISVGCTNENTYGTSCVHCGKCGRKFTMNGIDDSEVVSKKLKNIQISWNDNFSKVEEMEDAI